MRIIHVAWEAEGYGVGTFLLSLVPYQNNNNNDLKADIAFHKTNPQGEKIFDGKDINSCSLCAKKASDIKILLKFYKIFKNYDLIDMHTHSPLAFLAGKLAGKKVIYTFHGWTGIKRTLAGSILRLFHQYILSRFCDYYTFASNSSFKRYASETGKNSLGTGMYRIFPYGIHVSEVISRKSKPAIRTTMGWNGKFIFGTAARMDPNKRLEYLIQALHQMDNKENCLLVFIGDGEIDYKSHLKSLVDKFKLNGFVQFLGYRNDVYDILNTFDVFVLPTKEEPFGLALLEAMALSLPTIVFKDGGGAVDILGDSGIIVNSQTELVNAIEKLRNDTDLRNKIGNSVKERVKLFDISNAAKNLYAIYGELVTR